MRPDPERVIVCLNETAELDIMPRFQSLAADDVMEKKPGDLVTVADLDAEQRLGRLLREIVPGSVVIGEEAVHHEPEMLDRLGSDGAVWIIDPVDGTQNFTQGKPPFATVVAFLRKGRAVAGWIHDPVSGETVVAESGEGAWIDGRRLHVAPSGPIEEMRGLINSNAYGREHRDAVRPKKTAFGEVLRLGCAGFAFRELAEGNRHFSVYNRLWPWDHAAGVLIHAEAGGYSARVDRIAYRPIDAVQGLLSAPDEESWRRIDAFLRPN